MAMSDIEWTEATWNPIGGCKVLSPGCTNCYAMRMAARLQAMGMAKYAGTTRKSGKRHVWTGRINIDDSTLRAPLGWKKPQRIFVNSMSDLFQHGVDEEIIVRIWKVMAQARQHTFQILTKRPERMFEIYRSRVFQFCRMSGSAPRSRTVTISIASRYCEMSRRRSALYLSSLYSVRSSHPTCRTFIG